MAKNATYAPTDDPAILADLQAIGTWDFTPPPYPQIRWEQPNELPAAFAEFELLFNLHIEQPVASDYKQLLDEWDRLKQFAEPLIADAKRCALELFREVYAGQMWEKELSEYQDSSGTLSDQLVLAALTPNAICVAVSEDGIEAEICFHSEWDDEHGLDLEVEGNAIRRPWREV